MEGDSSSPMNGGPDDAPAPGAVSRSQGPEEAKSSPVRSMSGALQGDDTNEEMKTADEDEADSGANDAVAVAVEAPDAVVQPADSASAKDDGAVKDSNAGGKASDASGEANGTSSAAKKAHNSKRKSTGGVPEHKSKKVNKKKSMSKITHLDAQPGEYYFARLKSYPPWPAIICDEGMLPHSLLSTRPVTTKQADGSYKEAYGDGGKRVHERTFPIMFLGTNEFAWLPNTELTKLEPEDCKDFSEKGKTKSLIQAYHVAAEGHDIEHFKAMLLDHQKAMQEDQDRREARENAKAEKADRSGKKKRKSEAADEDEEDVEMEDVEEEAKPEAKKSSKKRKKEVESDGEDEKPVKTPKTATKLKLTTPKAPSTSEKKTKESGKASKAKSEKKKPKAAVSDEDVPEEEAKEAEKELDPAELKAKKEKEVLFLRHKLQKGFLARDQAPQESEMATMANFISKLENYGDLEVSIIRSTKINKVLKALIKLNTIPKDEEFNFKSRSVDLLGRWNKALGADSTADDAAGQSGGDKEEHPTTNGVHKEDKKPSEEKKGVVAAVTGAGQATSKQTAVEGKEEVIDKMVDGDAPSAEVAEEAENAGDASETS